MADKLSDAANLAAGALVFGQFFSDQPFSLVFAVLGSAIWVFFGWFAIRLTGGSRS